MFHFKINYQPSLFFSSTFIFFIFAAGLVGIGLAGAILFTSAFALGVSSLTGLATFRGFGLVVGVAVCWAKAQNPNIIAKATNAILFMAG
jgi:hypothetical protein